MKSLSQSLNSALLLTTMLMTPSLAAAQEQTPPATPPEAAEEAAETGEIVVLGRFIPEPMRQTSEVATFLSAADLERQGDDNAAAALTRLTGLSVVSGRFVFVRGLGDRYSSALLNGSPLPSPEPLRRTVPLDIFPSNILDGATVQKTYSPNYPGEFGGGLIDLKTVSQPNEPFLTVKLGTSVNPETTLRRGLIYRGSDTDWTGFDDGLRDIPGPLASAIATRRRVNGFEQSELERIGESFVNSPLSVIQTQDIAPDFEGEVTAGTSIEMGQFTLGLVGVGGWDSAWKTKRATRQLGTNGNADFARDVQTTTTEWDITQNALGSVSLGWDDSEVTFTGLYVHNTTKEAQIGEGFDFNVGGQVQEEGTAWYERDLASLQLSGDHAFGDFEIDWRVAAAQSTRDAPYERQLSRVKDATGTPFYARTNSYSIRFSELTDQVISGGVDGKYTIALSEQRDAVFSAGYAYSNTVRDYELFQFVFGGGSNLPADTARARPDFLFSPDNIDPNRFQIIELTGPDDSYKGGLLTKAAYAAADVELIPLLRAAVGVRYEDGKQTVRTLNRLGDPSVAPQKITNYYWLPAATLTWNFAEDLQLRLGYSQTIARPQFRELAVSPYIDPDSDRTYRGNPFLQDSELENFDARMEYYFGRNQFITGGAFYKTIERPIEEVIVESSTFNFITTFINAPKAVIYGAELEYRTNFELESENPLLAGKTWFFAANYTYTSSEVQAGAGDRVFDALNIGTLVPASNYALDGKKLQGQPENIANLQFGYETDASQMTLLLGWVDERILRRGLGNISDIIEDPGVNLDLVYRRDFTVQGQDMTFGFSARNLLNERYSETLKADRIGELDFNSYDRGVSLSASLSAKF